MGKLKILVVEDDALARKIMAKNLSEHETDFASDKKSALTKIKKSSYDICFIDLLLGESDDYSGLKILPKAKESGFYCVVISSSNSQEIIEKAYSAGADDFYVKGNENTAIKEVLTRFINSRKIAVNSDRIFSEEFFANDKETRDSVLELLKNASANLPVLILGPTGSGKTTLAYLVHKYSGRRGPFVDINCAAYNEELLEIELFGYSKGAFTGALDRRTGKLKEANGGTLFLDEIGTMSLSMQSKLLKAIEEKSFYPVGCDKKESSDFRIISATLEDPERLIKEGKLRFDLFQRLSGLKIKLKSLKERKEEILHLVNFFTKGKKKLFFSPDALRFISLYDWPGNIRQLKTLIEVLTADCKGKISERDVKKKLIEKPDYLFPYDAHASQDRLIQARSIGLEEFLDKIAYEIVKQELASNGGKATATIKNLKISTRRFYSLLKKFTNGKN